MAASRSPLAWLLTASRGLAPQVPVPLFAWVRGLAPQVPVPLFAWVRGLAPQVPVPLYAATLFLTLALLPGCGKKGALVPPEALVPAPVSDLSVAQKGGRFEVSWTAPSKEVGGSRLTDLAGFLLFKRALLPPSQDCEACPGAYPAPTRIDLDYPKDVRRLGDSFAFDDFDLRKGASYRYKVRSFTRDGAQSGDSNLARRTAVTAPLPPVVEALPSATGVVLAFVVLPPEEGTLLGYNIYRAKAGGATPLSPLNREPVTGPTFEDKGVLVGERYSYTVTSLAKVGDETVESAPSNLVEGAIVDRD